MRIGKILVDLQGVEKHSFFLGFFRHAQSIPIDGPCTSIISLGNSIERI